MTNFVNEYRIQSFLGALQILIGGLAWITSGTLGKFMGNYTPDDAVLAPIIRQSAIFLLLLPAIWVVLTIRWENDPTLRWSNRYTLVSGILLGVALIYLMSWSVNFGKENYWG